ncbi:unnamed protein product, partial [Ectocarpus sp. 12 AP-2014]
MHGLLSSINKAVPIAVHHCFQCFNVLTPSNGRRRRPATLAPALLCITAVVPPAYCRKKKYQRWTEESPQNNQIAGAWGLEKPSSKYLVCSIALAPHKLCRTNYS